MMSAAKGKKQVAPTLTADRLMELANDADRTLAGYIRWVLKEHLRETEDLPQ